MSLFSRIFSNSPGPEPDIDDQTLQALVDAGADLGKETEMLFFLYFPSEGHAHSASVVAQREGYTVKVSPPVEGYTEWLCCLTREMIPARATIKTVRARLEELAESFGGDFDGWEAAVRS